MDRIVMKDFLSPHSTQEKVVEIEVEPDTVYLEMGREVNYANFDFVVRTLSCTFTGVTLVENGQRMSYAQATLDTGDLVERVNFSASGCRAAARVPVREPRPRRAA